MRRSRKARIKRWIVNQESEMRGQKQGSGSASTRVRRRPGEAARLEHGADARNNSEIVAVIDGSFVRRRSRVIPRYYRTRGGTSPDFCECSAQMFIETGQLCAATRKPGSLVSSGTSGGVFAPGGEGAFFLQRRLPF
ncbi:hypothetical protein EVAR_98372_1 [Eumeta japonica]|uniref:Uncharacterized protein n=1 Tax=Eumeta variegata TaxID=151549 RepID=A0A4C2A4T7_EUMVA|nr:hypothetical protein EVAR_98372_1 [Eumeta japonica]